MDHKNNDIEQLIRDVKMESTFATKRKPFKSMDIEVALAYAFGDISVRQLDDAVPPGGAWETCVSPWVKHTHEIESGGWKVEEPTIMEFLQRQATKELTKSKAPEPWKPEDGEVFHFVAQHGKTFFFGGLAWIDHPDYAKDFISAGNCYRTREEAEKAAARVRKAYRG